MTAITCARCKEEKPADADHFRPRPETARGWKSWCLACERAYNAERKQAWRTNPTPSVDRQLPEHQVWVDDGCSVSPSCLNCPLPRCRYEETPEERQTELERKQNEVRQLRTAGVPREEVCRRFGISVRTYLRWVSGMPRAEPRPRVPEDDPRKAEAVRLRREGMAIFRIKRQLHISRPLLLRWFAEGDGA